MTVTLMCVSCSWNEYTDSPEMRKAYIQTHGESQDSTETGDNDSTYTLHSNIKGVENTTRCDLFIDGKLIVDGGTASDISDTNVTVEKIMVNVWADGKEMNTYYPEINMEVIEPSEVFGWNNLPLGIKYERKRLDMEPLVIYYKEHFYAEVTVCYILRVRDPKLAEGCTAVRYRHTVKCESSNIKGNRINILVPLDLMTVQLDATVDSYYE